MNTRFDLNTHYPLIANSKDYMIENRIVSINSEDRDIVKFPFASQFEIELPCDYLNVASVKLGSYAFPSNYNTFSITRGNVSMTFKITAPYNPADYGYFDALQNAMFDAMHAHIDSEYILVITEGFYTPQQIAVELTNRFNQSVNLIILEYLEKISSPLLPVFLQNGGYNQFVVVYNEVSQTLWFGNKSSAFTITNNSELYQIKTDVLNGPCSVFLPQIPEYENWGLPSYLGFFRCPVDSTKNVKALIYPRFYYGDVYSGDNGYWLTPDPGYKNEYVNYIQANSKINLMGDAYFFYGDCGAQQH